MKKFYIFVLAILSTVIARSQKIWDGPSTGGSWATDANWSSNIAPAAGDVVQFGADISGTITDVPEMSIAGLRIIDEANITFTQPGGGTNTLTITNGTAAVDFSITTGSKLILSTGVNISLADGTGMSHTTASFAGLLSLNGRVYNTNGDNVVTNVLTAGVIQVSNAGDVTSNSTAKLIYADGATYIHARNGGTVPTATWAADSKVNITGIIDATPTGLSQSFGDFEWNSTQAADISLSGNLQNITGDLTIAKTSVNTATWFLHLGSAANYTLVIGGDLIIEQAASDSTNVSFINDGDGDAVINVAGNYNHEDGNLIFVNVNADENDGTAILNLTGNLTQSGGDINFTEGINAGPAGQKGSLNIQGNLSQTAGTIRTTTGNDLIPNGLITFNKAGVQTFNVTDPAGITYTNYIVAAGSTLQLASDLRITRDEEDVFPNWVGKFTVNSGAVLDASTFVIGSQIVDDIEFPELAFANFNLLAGGKLITANDEGIEGSVDTTDHLLASFSSEADYEFQGASTGAFITTPTANTIRDIVVNPTGDDLTLAMPITVARQLILTNGLLTTTAGNLLTIGPDGSATAATPASFVNGPLAKRGTTEFTFPVGKPGAGFRNIGITAPTGIATFRAEFFRDNPPGGTLAPGLVRVSTCEYWDLTKTAGGTGVSASVILSWEANSTCGSSYVTDPTTLRVAHLLSGVWVNEGGESGTGDNTAGTITSGEALTDFSPFALASSSASENPLPVLFADVKAYEKNNGVQIEWSNLTEKDVAAYTIERSANGSNFSAIAQQLPTSNQNDRSNYSVFDPSPDAGTNFYRIKAEETTGKIVYSNVLSVNLGKSGESFRLYPNPVTSGQVTISLSNIKRGLYTLRVINTAGQDVFRQTITSQGRTITQTLSLPSVIKPGTYHMSITGEGYRENKMFIIR